MLKIVIVNYSRQAQLEVSFRDKFHNTSIHQCITNQHDILHDSSMKM